MSFACRHEDLRLYAYGFLDPAEEAVIESHLEGCADCRQALAEFRDESLLVAFELSLDTGETSAEPAPARPSRLRRVVPIAAAVAAVGLFLAALWSVFLGGDGSTAPVPPVGPVASGGERPAPEPTAIGPDDRTAELLARLAELEEEVKRLAAARDAGPIVPHEEQPELAIEKHDWAGLASALAGVAPEVAKGRMPSDPDLLKAYLEALEALRDLARAVGTPATVKEVARDPRTGPYLFAAALRQSWPEAPEQDIETATRAAQAAMGEYAGTVAVADTPAERAAAETALTDVLSAQVRKLTEAHGEPAITPVGAGSGASTDTGVEETEDPVRVRPQAVDPEDSEGTTEPAENDGESVQTTPAVTDVLNSAGIAPVTDRVYRGSAPQVAESILKGWQSDFGLSVRAAGSLSPVAAAWIRSYRNTLAATRPDTVAALEARLGRGTAPVGVTAAEVRALRDALLAVQAEAERRVMVQVPAARTTTSVRTYFLVD